VYRHAHPPGGGPPPHRHDFEEAFILLEGEMEATFRGREANGARRRHTEYSRQCSAPVSQRFHCAGTDAVYLLSAGQEKIFLEVGVPVATRTTPPPKLD